MRMRIDYDSLPPVNQRVFDIMQDKADGKMSIFARTLGITPQAISRLFRINTKTGKYPTISSEIKQALFDKYGVSEVDLLDANKNINMEQDGIPYFEAAFDCGFVGGISDAIVNRNAISTITLPNISNDEGTFSVRARGDSMVNPDNPARSINNGDIVVMRVCKGKTIEWGQPYGIATTDNFLIKRVMPTDDPDKILCVSLNPEYPPIELSSSECFGMARVIANFTLNMW